MCGLAGFTISDPSRGMPGGAQSEVAVMLSALAHRGPDGMGIESFEGAVLGHRRLAVIDLTARGAQPMRSGCGPAQGGHAWIVCNGEIYNYVELREELGARGHRFDSDTDTEVILHLYEEDGPECVGKLRGMFAFALWDAGRRRLLLARDRLGKKPLYYREERGGLVFASELKAITARAHARGEQVDVDPAAIREYLALKYVPGPTTAVAGARKVPPAHLMIYERGRLIGRPYWDLPAAASDTPLKPSAIREELREALRESVMLRMRSDVPLGLFLSGGLDSGAIAWMMADLAGGKKIRTFTVGFGESEYDEVETAAKVAHSLGTDHHEIRLRPDPASTADALPELAWQLDQPFADSSALAVHRLAGEVRRHVTVVLSGDGGDELFLGYDRYRAHRLADRIAWLGAAGGRLAGLLVRAALPEAPGRRNLSGRARRFIDSATLGPARRNDAWVGCIGPDLAGDLLERGFLEAAARAAPDPLASLHHVYGEDGGGGTPDDALRAIQRADLLVYLPDDILHKVDSATMAHALEARSPFLDHHVVELAMRIPPRLKLRGGKGKAILREAFSDVLPPEVARGRKAGFGLPLDRWLRGELSGYCRDVLLDPGALSRSLLRREGVETLLDEHVTGRANREDAIWSLVMLEHWLRAFIGRARAEELSVPA